MSVSIHAESTAAVDADRAAAIFREASKLFEGRCWLSCEEPLITMGGPSGDDRLYCFFTPDFSPDPDDLAEVEASGEPDGTAADAIDILARLSRDHGVDWEVGHDAADGTVGYIRAGVVDGAIPDAVEFLRALATEARADPDADE